MGLELAGARVTLRSLRTEDYEAVRAGLDVPGYGGDPSDERSDRRLRARISRSGRLVDGFLDLGVEAEGRLVGDVGARRPRGGLPPGVFELGISIYDEADRGKGYGREAVSLLTSHLFARLDARRVQATTAVANDPMRAVLRGLGFREEGVLRGFMPLRDGTRDDYVMCAVLRDEWNGRARVER
jgi:RimJ/RimL family protein N-acetyltransferase